MSGGVKSRAAYIERFLARIDRRGPDECWPYLKYCDPAGYGFYYIGHHIIVHRFAYEIAHGEGSADGWQICHTCDNPSCCNPAHLFKGTGLDNMRDKIAKGRDRIIKGDECSWSKLTEQDVRNIRARVAAGEVQRRIAAEYAVTPSLICYVVKGKAWGHVR